MTVEPKIILNKVIGLLLIVGCNAVLGAAESIPERFQGTWILDMESTSKAIEDETALPAELSEAWKSANLLQFDYVITADRIENWISTVNSSKRRGGAPEIGSYLVEMKEEGPEYTVFVMNKDPAHCPAEGCGPDLEKYFHLRLREDDSLVLRESTARGWDRSDALQRLFVMRRSNAPGVAAARSSSENDTVAYLDGLKTCTPGLHRLSYIGLGDYENRIVGPNADRCQVEIVHTNLRLRCEFTRETIALLTGSEKYVDARSGVLRGSTDSPESARLAEECAAE